MATSFRNFLFDINVFKSKSFNTPIISVGNITVGGTGKTPHTEYLINSLKDEFYIACLSRGYKRSTKGYILSDENSTAEKIGDEPAQIRSKFTNIELAVDEKRVRGIEKLTHQFPQLDCIVLDDAYQHRWVKPGISILLVDYNRMITKDKILPYGNLRESWKNKDRANMIIISKCPDNIPPIERRLISKELEIMPYQKLFFTKMSYGELQPIKINNSRIEDREFWKKGDYEIVLVTGIANNKSIVEYVSRYARKLHVFDYGDHHNFTKAEISEISNKFNTIDNPKKIIITTEKDETRLLNLISDEEVKKSTYSLPIEVEFLFEEKKDFNKKIKDYIKKNNVNARFN
jgi:tetraacyldisaccharide 4'-kinase